MFFARKGRLKRSKEKNSLQKQKTALWQKTCFGALQRGVLTVELAFIIPLFLMGTMTLVCFMDVLRIRTEKISSLCEKAMEAGVHAYLAGEKLSIIDIPEIYTYRLPVSIVPLPAFVITDRGRVHSWVGADPGPVGDGMEEMVYMAVSGSVYHRDPRCSYINLSITQAAGRDIKNMRNKQGARYIPCASCSKGKEPAKIVYITGQGNRYHGRVSCSRLKRTVRLIPLSEAGGRPACSRCGSKGK